MSFSVVDESCRGGSDQYAFPGFRLHAAVIGVSGRVPHQAYFFVPAKHASADRALEPEGSPPDGSPGYCGALFAYIITAKHMEAAPADRLSLVFGVHGLARRYKVCPLADS